VLPGARHEANRRVSIRSSIVMDSGGHHRPCAGASGLSPKAGVECSKLPQGHAQGKSEVAW